MTRTVTLAFLAMILMAPTLALAGPSEDANAAVDRWSFAYGTNDPETIAKTYCPTAVLLGTVSSVISEGTQAIVKYFTPIKGRGNTNTIEERRTITINDSAAVVTGFYTFTRMVDGKSVPGPSRFTMLVTKQGNEWCIAHHQSSPHVLPKN
ncbi:SgcJ/EcaC family oxidoreductase [Bradyrhizobium sp. BWA-3-5]|uniref:SgcJ/EcaC family oxidoreductase n=1 Tax=Bradyrhizobium sp. BWA-3-5 TaxID=3080013 RepID=UPI00293EBB8B|nr:SgcJ/EcaC family oxidoreductase [Bradyrhizobium sp. BWA-3-5]WOH67974.1 SgcJ/EcaC family oxidoreductase [Bradyrhizobium sp. BWA-3-5]